MSKVEAEAKRATRKLTDDVLGIDSPPAPGGYIGYANPSVAARGHDFETRKQAVKEQARAAGAARTDNDADLLGYSPRRKRAGQARAMLGG